MGPRVTTNFGIMKRMMLKQKAGRLVRPSILLLCGLFAVCGYGRTKVACIGDSITFGTCIADRARDGYPAQLQRLLDREFPGEYEVRNFGNPGKCVYLDELTWGKNKKPNSYYFMPEHRAALDWRPDIVVSNLGINDYEAYPKEERGEKPRGQFVRDYLTILGDYRNLPTHPKLFIWTKLGPLLSTHRGFRSEAPFRMRADLEKVAQAAGAVGLDLHTPFFPAPERFFTADGVHPNPDGAAVVAKTTFAALTGRPADDTVAAALAAFRDPPPEARPRTWWHWLNGKVTDAAITSDLEAMAEAGLGGAQVFEWRVPGEQGPVAFASSNWFAKVAFAAREAKRLGLVLGAHNCSGCSSSGGPWVDAAHAMKRLTADVLPADAAVETNGHFVAAVRFRLPRQKGADGKYAALTNLKCKVFAAPDWNNDWRAVTPEVPPELCVGKTGEEALLVVRWETLPTRNNPATPSGEGYETDKFSAEATRLHFAAYPAKLKGLITELLIDSYERGPQNWTVGFEREFARRRGYAMDRWYPVFAGFIVDSSAASERFVADFRRTCSELFCENYAAEMKRLANGNGMLLMAENYGDLPADPIDYGRAVDVPMSEFWFKKPPAAPGPGYARFAASAAAANGGRIVASEAFTAMPADAERPWGPGELTPFADAAFAAGVNSLYLHTWVQPDGGTRPRLVTDDPAWGLTYWGTMFSPDLPWWPEAKRFFFRLARCQAALRCGARVAATWGSVDGPAGDFTCDAKDRVAFTHRRLWNGDLYFLAPSVRTAGTALASFGADGAAELWDPQDGSNRPLARVDGRYAIPLDRAVFVVFQR